MAALGERNPTLLDLAKRQDPNGSIATIVEMLNTTNEILTDMTFVEGNLTTGHKTTVRTGLPTPTWRKLYGFVQPTKSTTAQITDTTGNMEAYAEVDADLVKMSGNPAEFRLSEDRPHLEGMNQEMAEKVFYGNEALEPEAFTGLGPRFNVTTGANAENMIDGGGSGSDNTSIWLAVWGPETVHGIIPKGSTAGFQQRDLGEVTKESTSGLMQVMRTHYKWQAGVCVRDWRYLVRICNVDKSALVKDAATGADLIDLMTQALELPPSLSMGRPAFYCSRTIRSFLRRQMVAKVKSSTLTMENVAGKKVLFFDEVPVRRCDALAADEAAISF